MRTQEDRCGTEQEARPTGQGGVGYWFSAGSVLTALAAAGASCCFGPLLFTALGLSSFTSLWLLERLVPYRMVFLAGTALFLGLGFYISYRTGAHVRGVVKRILWASTLLVIALLGYSFYREVILYF
jgi:mercuric ion transport protein